MRLWDVATGRPLAVLEHDGLRVEWCVWSPDGRRLLAGSNVERELTQTLELIILVLQDMEEIYRQLPKEQFETAAKQLGEKIEKYEQLRAQYGEHE